MANQFTDQEEIKCAFCGKTQDQVKKMIAGNGVYICNECVDLAKKIIDDELRADSLKAARELPKPVEIKKELDQYVIGQDRAKKSYQLLYIITIRELAKWMLILQLNYKNQILQ